MEYIANIVFLIVKHPLSLLLILPAMSYVGFLLNKNDDGLKVDSPDWNKKYLN